MIEKIAPLSPGDRVGLVSPINLPPKKYRDYGRLVTTLMNQGLQVRDMTCESDYAPRRIAS